MPSVEPEISNLGEVNGCSWQASLYSALYLFI